MRKHECGLVQLRCKIVGYHNDERFEYQDQESSCGSMYVHPDGDPGLFWWSDGNGGCFCNRAKYVGVGGDVPCGSGEVLIDYIAPIEGVGDYHVLALGESERLFTIESDPRRGEEDGFLAVLCEGVETPVDLDDKPLWGGWSSGSGGSIQTCSLSEYYKMVAGEVTGDDT